MNKRQFSSISFTFSHNNINGMHGLNKLYLIFHIFPLQFNSMFISKELSGVVRPYILCFEAGYNHNQWNVIIPHFPFFPPLKFPELQWVGISRFSVMPFIRLSSPLTFPTQPLMPSRNYRITGKRKNVKIEYSFPFDYHKNLLLLIVIVISQFSKRKMLNNLWKIFPIFSLFVL